MRRMSPGKAAETLLAVICASAGGDGAGSASASWADVASAMSVLLAVRVARSVAYRMMLALAGSESVSHAV